MRMAKRGAVFLIAVAIAASVSGCRFRGQERKDADPPEAQGQEQGGRDRSTSLELRIVRASKADGEIPSREFDLSSARTEDRVIFAGDEWVFQDNVHLPDADHPGAVFLVWPESWGKDKIQGAVVEHRLEDPRGEPLGAAKRLEALFDVETRRWYLPISAFCEDESEGADPALQHVLSLDLTLSGSGRKLVHVRLRVIGAVPRLDMRFEELPAAGEDPRDLTDAKTPDFSSELSDIWRRGQTVARLSVLNPARRPLRLSFEATKQDGIELKHWEGQLTYYQKRETAIPDPQGLLLHPPSPHPIDWRLRSTRLEVAAVRLSSDWRDEHVVKLPSDEASSILIGAGEALRVEWLAFPQAGQASWEPPAGGVRHFEWPSPRALDCMLRFYNHLCTEAELAAVRDRADLPEPWRIGGYALNGEWAAKVSVFNPWDGRLTRPLPFKRPIAFRSGYAP
jgi:hypothetical protein